MKKFGKIFASSITICGFAFSGLAFADAGKSNKAKAEEAASHHAGGYRHKSSDGFADLGKGWKITSTGGLSYVNPESSVHWFKLSGLLRLDETIFSGTYRDKGPQPNSTSQFSSGALVRAGELYFDGGIGENWAYTMTLQYTGGNGTKTSFGDTNVSYLGLLAEKNQIFVGRVSGNYFGLDGSNSSSWNPFLERSAQALTFYMGDGLGVLTDFWCDEGAITFAAFQPDQGSNSLASAAPGTSPTTGTYGSRDRWTGVVRATIAPVHEAGDVWHFGLSGGFKEIIGTNSDGTPNKGFSYSGNPSARSRSVSPSTGPLLLNTTYDNGAVYIRANNARLYNVEFARQMGPIVLEAEYTTVAVHRVNATQGDLTFRGWNVQGRYLLTGEYHAYDVRDGAFGAVQDIRSPYGALELAARYDFINLNSKDIQGGTQHQATLGLNWFVNQQVRVSANYIRANIHPSKDTYKRNLDIFGMRLQLRFK